MYDYIVSAVESDILERWFEPPGHWPNYWFDKQAYSRWASYEILKLLKNGGDKRPTKIVEEFVDKMDNYYCVRDDTRKMFEIARSAAEDILDVIRAMDMEKYLETKGEGYEKTKFSKIRKNY